VIANAPTHQSWFNQLRSRPHGKIVNFWTPTPWNVRRLKPGDLLYFLLKGMF
jgi:putative restriction endonuclease